MKDARQALSIFLVGKLLVLWLGAQAFLVVQNEPLPPHGLEIWNRWDAPHYIDILNHGYVATGEERKWIVFFPLFPWIARGLNVVVRNPVTSAFLVANLFSLVAAWLLFRLVQIDEGDARARDAVFFLAIFPTSYFLHIGYTESLFLALSLAAFLAARREQWMAAGIVGAFASLARVNGVLLIPALAIEAFVEWRRTRKFDPRWLWIAFIATGLVAGDWFAFRVYQRDVWNRTLAMPWVSIYDAWLSVWERAPADAIMVGWQELLFTAIAIAVTIWSWLRLRASYAMWATLNVLIWTSTGFLLSAPRYALMVFPIYLCFARISDRRPLVRALIVIWSLLWLGVFTRLFATGKWAF